jgi:hypothetical protein
MERQALLAECKAWCQSLPECGDQYYPSLQGCRSQCDPNEPHDSCVTLSASVYRCMRLSGTDCKNKLRIPRAECLQEYALLDDCENLAGSPDGGDRLRAACEAKCDLAAACSGVADNGDCKRACNKTVADTFAECIPAATAAQSCINERGAMCRAGQLVGLGPDPCKNERLASEACHRRFLDCEGANRDGQCPAVSCDCAGVKHSITEPEIHGKWCRCVPDFECHDHCFYHPAG